MSGNWFRDAQPAPMMQPFPEPGRLVQVAYRDLHLAANGTAAEKEAVGPSSSLARPWDPSTCINPRLRHELWAWLDDFVVWLNHDHIWDLADHVPSCWPNHPHLSRELAILADQRRRATHALSSDQLEDWHRYSLPAFIERTRSRTRSHCVEGHRPWPARGRHSAATSDEARHDRRERFAADVAALMRQCSPTEPERPVDETGLVVIDGLVVNSESGEVASGSQSSSGPRP